MANSSQDASSSNALREDQNNPATQHASKQVVEQGYDKIAAQYLEWTTSTASPRLSYLRKLLTKLPPKSKVLELGCGAGVPGTQLLAQSHDVTGNDISAAQLELARKNVPDAHFVKEDMTRLDFEKGTFNAVVAFYSVIHLPREEQRVMLKRIGEWLGDGGYLLFNLGANDDPGEIQNDWMGADMYWSSYDAKTNEEMVRAAGFDLIEEEITMEEEVIEGHKTFASFLWILARKREAEGS